MRPLQYLGRVDMQDADSSFNGLEMTTVTGSDES